MLHPVSNPPNRFHEAWLEWLDAPVQAQLEVFEEEAKSIISTNDSPDLGFEHSINPYRGCFHGCAYCYARPSHQYLDFGAGTDFERKIIVKINAASKLREAFLKPSWKGDLLVFSGNTDCYQPLEASYQLTRKCLEVCGEFCNPVSIITKGAIIVRDLDILKHLHQKAKLHVTMSIAFCDDEMSRRIEPFAPRPSTRFRAMKELSSAGISVGLALAPVIPGLNDSQIPEILNCAKESGAATAFMTLLRLPGEVKDVFLQRMSEAYPERLSKVLTGVSGMKEGKLNRSEFGKRMKGDGPHWEALDWVFRETCRKLGLNRFRQSSAGGSDASQTTFQRPSAQLSFRF